MHVGDQHDVEMTEGRHFDVVVSPQMGQPRRQRRVGKHPNAGELDESAGVTKPRNVPTRGHPLEHTTDPKGRMALRAWSSGRGGWVADAELQVEEYLRHVFEAGRRGEQKALGLLAPHMA